MSNPHLTSYQWKAEGISSKIRNKTKIPTLTNSSQHSIVSHSNQKRKTNKRNQDKKGRIKTITVCRWHDTTLRKSKNHHLKNHNWSMNSVNLQDTIYRNLLHFCILTMNYQTEELKKTIPCWTTSKRIKYLGINITKEVKDQYSENKKLKMIQIDEKIHCVQELKEVILLQWSYYSRPSIDSMQSLSKHHWHFSEN